MLGGDDAGAMPEVHLQLEWPDGQITALYSPSTVVLEYLQPGQALSVSRLGTLGRQALREASERVRARYGFACTRTVEEERRLQAWTSRYDSAALVTIRLSAP